MPEIPVTPNQYQQAAQDALGFTGQDPTTLSAAQQQELAGDISTMAQFQSSIGAAAVNNPNSDPSYVLSQLSTLQGQPLDAAMILNLAAGRPALWSPTVSNQSANSSSIGAWTSSPFVSFLISCAYLAVKLRNNDAAMQLQSAYMSQLTAAVGKDIANTKFQEQQNQSQMYQQLMVASLVSGCVSVTMSAVSFGLSMGSAAYGKGSGANEDIPYSKQLGAAATFMEGIAQSVNKFGSAAENAIHASFTLTQGTLEQSEQLLNTLMQVLKQASDVINQADQDTRSQFQELLKMMQDETAQLLNNVGIGVRG